MSHTSRNLKRIFLDKIETLDFKVHDSLNLRRMEKRLYDEFDKTWIKYNNNEATYKEWQQSLDEWWEVHKL